ncbi:ectoine hydroxylase [Natronospira bacteriovora]|uniref:Ectoine hydroxylase n=1 Tax=Natronospira bacteriovora TaxID=3069753 RepID=A0ABU0W948_9GAMM|nr:ectoine hydroxylase [Natronospira sp. AB-CW4]MDQ2070564.1 ectoine hydroxylase [Natronospira sp. AB-CW4]
MAATVQALQNGPQTCTRLDPYPSRRTSPQTPFPRLDPVVYGGQHDGPLDNRQLTQYEQDGFLFMPGLFSPSEISMLRNELNRLDARPDNRERPEVITEADSQSIRSVFAIHRHQSPLGRLCRDPRLLAIARQLLGSGVYIHQSRINYKPGFRGREFYWHSDFETWHSEDGMPRMRAVSCSVLFTDNNACNGGLMLIPGSHHQFIPCQGSTPDNNHLSSLQKQTTGVPDEVTLAHLVETHGIRCPEGPAGSVLFFECNTLHGSNGNITPQPRSNAFFVYNSIHNRLTSPYAAPQPRPGWLAERELTTPIVSL